jgi:hypothetical protein
VSNGTRVPVKPISFIRRAACIAGLAWTARAAEHPDTIELARHLKAVRGKLQLNAREYQGLQGDLLRWIDLRVKAGESVEAMNLELKSVELFADWTDVSAAIDQKHAGYLEPLSTHAIGNSRDTMLVEAQIYMGIGCTVDSTAILYGRGSRRRLGYLNGRTDGGVDALHLSGFDIGAEDDSGDRLIASGWTFANCTSVWNGKRIRIDKLKASVVRNLFERDLAARSREPEDVSSSVRGSVATFRYDGAAGDLDLMATSAVARYGIDGDRVVREAPVALTRAGFVYEWINMDEAEAARWGDAAAIKVRKSVVSAMEKHAFEWQRVAHCDTSPPAWELAIRVDEPARLFVFRFRGERATDFRMLDVLTRPTESCAAVDITKGLTSIAAELPW